MTRTFRRVLCGGLGALLVVLLVAGYVVYRAYLAAPTDAPEDVAGSPRAPGTSVTVIAGASIVRGSLSADWVSGLRTRFGPNGVRFVNAGVNGNTTADLVARLDADVTALRPDRVVLLVGTNDVRDDAPLEASRRHLEQTLDHLRSRTTARIAVLSLPPLGEDLDSSLNQRVTAFNAMLRDAARARGATYLPLHERLVTVLGNRRGPAYDFTAATSLRVAVDRYLLGRGFDDIAEGNGLRVLIDHVHLSDRGGAVAQDLVAGWVSTPASPGPEPSRGWTGPGPTPDPTPR